MSQAFGGASWLGRTVQVRIESPRGSFVKRRAEGGVDFLSPWPVPYNYGHVPGELGGDGDPLDALVVGPRRPAGDAGAFVVRGVVHFVDAGQIDDKLIVGEVDARARAGVMRFFAVYAVAKRTLNRVRGKTGMTAVRGVAWSEP